MSTRNGTALKAAPGTRLSKSASGTAAAPNGRFKRGMKVKFQTAGRGGLSSVAHGTVVRTHATTVGDYIEIKPDGSAPNATVKTRARHVQATA